MPLTTRVAYLAEARECRDALDAALADQPTTTRSPHDEPLARDVDELAVALCTNLHESVKQRKERKRFVRADAASLARLLEEGKWRAALIDLTFFGCSRRLQSARFRR